MMDHYKKLIKETFKGTFKEFNEFHEFGSDHEFTKYYMDLIGWDKLEKNIKGMSIRINDESHRIYSIVINYIEFDDMKEVIDKNLSIVASLNLINSDDSLRISANIVNGIIKTMYGSDVITDDEIDIIKNGKIII